MKQTVFYLFALLFAASLVTAQTPEAKPAASPAKPAKAKAEKVGPLEKERRDTALRLINELADEARTFRNEALRARVQARAADTIWETDQERARALYRRAWDAADIADRESRRKFDEELRAAQERGEGFAGRGPSNLRNEVLRSATRRDRALGEEFLEKLDEARKTETAPAATETQPAQNSDADDPFDLPPALSQRLQAATELLQMGETERALQFADPGLARVTMPALHFLSQLRLTNANAADQRYAAMLARAANAPDTNANTVSLLSSYIFTPNNFSTVSRQGGLSSNGWGPYEPPIDAPALRGSYLSFAASVLMRQLPPLDQPDAKGRRTGVYMVITRLLPLFEQFLPEAAPGLRAQAAALAADVSESNRDPRNSWLTRGIVPREQQANPGETALERAERAKKPEERDTNYAVAALSFLEREPERAYNILDKISDNELRRSVRGYMDFEAMGRAINKKDPAEALRLARKGELTHIQRVWGLTESARLISKTAPPQAVEVLEEAAAEARRISPSEPDRVSGLVAVATRLYELDRARAWEYVNEAVKAANSGETYSGEDSHIGATVRAKNFAYSTNSSVESFDLAGLFRTLTKEDLNRAIQTAKGFNQETPRATALLSVARQILAKKGGEASIRQERSVSEEN